MASEAGWWTDPESGKGNQGSSVVRHAPDDDQYHLPDRDMLGKMRGSLVGQFAVIPAADKDGRSLGFDPTKPGLVHVDPDAPDGGVVFDPGAVRKSDIEHAVGTSRYPHQAFYKLGVAASALGIGRRRAAAQDAQPARDNPHLPPGSYIVPAAEPVHSPAPYEDVPVNPMPSFPQPAPFQQPQQVVMVPQFSHAGPQGAQPPGGLVPVDPNQNMVMNAILSMQHQIATIMANQQRASAPHAFQTTGVSPVPMPTGLPALATTPAETNGRHRSAPAPVQGRGYEDESARPIRRRRQQDEEEPEVKSVVRRRQAQEEPDERQTVREYEEASEGEQEKVIVGFETLKIKWLNGPLATKPKMQVIFELPNAGRTLARYHDVLIGEGTVTLVYDTRYEDGFQWAPPDLQEVSFPLHVPKLKKTFKVNSMGMTVAFGVFDLIILVKQEEEALDYTEGE
jgi:hypothetical protein